MHHNAVDNPGSLPEVFVAVSSTMKSLYSKYRDVLSFDLTFNLIKDRHPSGKKWKIGCFVATSAAKRITPLGLVVCLHEKTEVYQHYRGCPGVLVTDEERVVGAALS